MARYIYVLQSLSNGDLYKGYSEDLDRRLEFHNSGKSKFTSRYMPWKLAYYKIYDTKAEAMQREKFFKSGKGRSG